MGIVPRCFADLCVPDPEFNADENLVSAAQGSPRKMMSLAHKVLSHHLQNCDGDRLISIETIKTVLSENNC